MHLERASEHPPRGLAELLALLGPGEAGFGGTPFGRGECPLGDFLRACLDGDDPAKVPAGFVPQTVYWVVAGDDRRAVGMVRLRHRLTDRLLQAGGHVGYYVHPAHRRRGYATRALGLALGRLRGLGVDRALLTADPANAGSVRVILANGGTPDGQGVEPDTGHVVSRYWVDLLAAPPPPGPRLHV